MCAQFTLIQLTFRSIVGMAVLNPRIGECDQRMQHMEIFKILYVVNYDYITC